MPNDANVASKIIMTSQLLKDIFSELDSSSEFIQFIISSEQPSFCIKTSGPAGSINITVTQSSDLVEHFSSSSTNKARYRLAMIKHGIKHLGLSAKVSVRTDDREFLCLQFMVRTDSGPAFIEYYCAPEEDSPDSPVR